MDDKQIEEMAKVASINCGECYTCEFCAISRSRVPNCVDYLVANEFYKQGYRKIDEDSTIISKKKLLEIANDYTEMAKFHTEKQKEIDQARKQAIKEFVQAILKDANITYHSDEVTTSAYVDIDDIYYIAIDKFGVEI